MRISNIKIKNFRLLQDVELCLEKSTTVIVGRNNTGKTSLTELFRRLLSEGSPTFRLEDFSLGVHERFWKAFQLKHEGQDDDKIREELPAIEATLTVDYCDDKEFGPLSDFIIDLDPSCTEALVTIRYHLEAGKIEPLFEGLVFEDDKKQLFFKALKERIPKFYSATLAAIDANDEKNTKPLEFSRLRALLQSGFINAQRGLDDTTSRDKETLGKILQSLLETASAETADQQDRDIARDLEEAVENIQNGIDKGFNKQLERLLPAFELFGYPGLRDPDLRTETTLEVERLLKDNTKIRYAGVNGIHLPEAYNGLGVRNLIFILLKLLEFFKSFRAKQAAPGIHLVFIEEPEAHLHPQMQEVFIRKLVEIARKFAETYSAGQPWPVQFIVTTHSSHMANEAPFDSMRYFLTTSEQQNGEPAVAKTQIKDLRKGLGGEDEEDRKFLHQYMTLTRCDLLFADKAILIEGTTDRLLLLKMIEKIEDGKQVGSRLSSQYVAVMEVGGAYAHRFYNLLDFLELHTLIITDLDTINKNDSGKACKVSEGTGTSNGCIKDWFENNITPTQLASKTDQNKIKGSRRLAYQVPEQTDDPCGRSFEDAFMFANPALFGIEDADDKEQAAWDIAKGVKKSNFAIKYAIEESNWVVPRYIREGLEWLADPLPPPAAVECEQSSEVENTPQEGEIDG